MHCVDRLQFQRQRTVVLHLDSQRPLRRFPGSSMIVCSGQSELRRLAQLPPQPTAHT